MPSCVIVFVSVIFIENLVRGAILHHPFQRRRVLRGAVLVLLRAAASSRDLCTTLVGVEAVEASAAFLQSNIHLVAAPRC